MLSKRFSVSLSWIWQTWFVSKSRPILRAVWNSVSSERSQLEELAAIVLLTMIRARGSFLMLQGFHSILKREAGIRMNLHAAMALVVPESSHFVSIGVRSFPGCSSVGGLHDQDQERFSSGAMICIAGEGRKEGNDTEF
jgi:hypothetical protein